MKLLLITSILILTSMFSVFVNAKNLDQGEINGDISISFIKGLSLNNGKKWEMDSHTRQSFINMKISFSDVDIESLNSEELKNHGMALQSNIDSLIKGCTMVGAPHDSLHMLLMEFIPEIDLLVNTGNTENAKNIQYYLLNYSKYFR